MMMMCGCCYVMLSGAWRWPSACHLIPFFGLIIKPSHVTHTSPLRRTHTHKYISTQSNTHTQTHLHSLEHYASFVSRKYTKTQYIHSLDHTHIHSLEYTHGRSLEYTHTYTHISSKTHIFCQSKTYTNTSLLTVCSTHFSAQSNNLHLSSFMHVHTHTHIHIQTQTHLI